MVSQMDKNTIECVSQLQGKIEYNNSTPIAKDDLHARLIEALGNPSEANKMEFTDSRVVF